MQPDAFGQPIEPGDRAAYVSTRDVARMIVEILEVRNRVKVKVLRTSRTVGWGIMDVGAEFWLDGASLILVERFKTANDA